MGGSVNGDTQKSMVYFMENSEKWMRTGGRPMTCWKPPYGKYGR